MGKSTPWPRAHRPVKVGLNLEQIAIETFLPLTCSVGLSNEHTKSLQVLDTGNLFYLHKSKMAAVGQ